MEVTFIAAFQEIDYDLTVPFQFYIITCFLDANQSVKDHTNHYHSEGHYLKSPQRCLTKFPPTDYRLCVCFYIIEYFNKADRDQIITFITFI